MLPLLFLHSTSFSRLFAVCHCQPPFSRPDAATIRRTPRRARRPCLRFSPPVRELSGLTIRSLFAAVVPQNYMLLWISFVSSFVLISSLRSLMQLFRLSPVHY